MNYAREADSASIFKVKPVSLRFIASVIIVHIIFTLIVNLILFDNSYLSFFPKSTNGWISETLAANLIGLVVEVIIVLGMIGKLSPKDFGFIKATLVPGMLGTLLFWVALSVVDILMTLLFTSSTLTYNNNILMNPGFYLGNFLAQIFGNALLEEIIFRGFLFVQIYLLFRKINTHTTRIMYAILTSQAIFAATHIPNRIYGGLVGMEFVYDFFMIAILGAVFVLLYLLTKNLFFVIGVHALINVQLTFWNSNFTFVATLICVLLLTCYLLVLKRKVFRAKKSEDSFSL